MNAKTEAKHTPEPWVVFNLSNGHTAVFPVDRGEKITDIYTPLDMKSNHEANAHRIVSAVNACEGISTEALENGVVKELLQAAKFAVETINAWELSWEGTDQMMIEQLGLAIDKAEAKEWGWE